jgi:hypothetical protein
MVSSQTGSMMLGQLHHVKVSFRAKSSVNLTYRLKKDILRDRIAVEVVDRNSPESISGKVVDKELYTRSDEQLI